ncbi:hypothetical protein K1T71_010715 [Dendrolimus kikuchii]|uniref:Uncharacterized protein n=1 Tax=Dendrolimus kikuchii TaxID=765133 RepID=A0ACC1CPQ5_9NEOP|nr:hypothetical protein K1T71_010715 [Dendrolimus kikuchii]
MIILTCEIICFSIAIFGLIYIWFYYKFTYWLRKGVDGPKPMFPCGNLQKVLRSKEQFFQPYCDNYFKYKNLPYVGMYSFQRPVLLINDLDIAKLILIKDFEYFQSRGTFAGGPSDPLSENLFNIHGTPWKNLRLKMTPSFSSAKVKSMYSIVNDISTQAVKYAESFYAKQEAVNFTELYSKYAMEIIANVGFGVECNGFTNPRSEFYTKGTEYFDNPSLYWRLIRSLSFFAPDLFGKLKIKRITQELEDFFFNLVKNTVEYRKKHSYKRNDFLQSLIELKDGYSDETLKLSSFTMMDIAANAMLYMIAGYETSATTGQFAAYLLAANPQIQKKAREEIFRVLARHDGEFSFEAQNEMIYMNMVIDESMRMYPSMRAIFRRCNKEYQLPTGLVIEKGTMVFIPANAIHMDPDLYPDPEKFEPERFSSENKTKMHPCQWIPFGEGPKKCLGIRQGYIQTKMALVKILLKYELLLDERMTVPIKIKASSLVCAAEGGIWLKLRTLDALNQ